ncbi:MAG TPA: DMT family transporter [Parachlamydiaceae bacterium]|nr:DMT family transporter [Parachlamydiaceae bacterium]
MFYVILLYALFASVFTIAKAGLEYAEPLFFVGARMMIAGALMLLFQYIFYRDSFIFKKEHFFRIFRLSLFNIYLTNAFEFWGLKHLTSFKACFIYSLSPFVSALLSYAVFSEKLSFKKWIGLLIGFLGLTPILLSQTALEETTGHLFFFSFAELSVIGAVFSSVYGWILLSQLVKENGYSPFMANGLSMLIGGAMALFHSRCTESWDPVPVSSWIPFLSAAFLLILISNFICYNLYGELLKRHSATFMSVAGFTTSFFTAFFGWVYLGETITWPFYLSAFIVFSGLMLFYFEEIKDSETKALRNFS